ncbi:unnamed protein product [Dibothriocephalus latus]|uniref:Uncharacterized protein n=1 Tax=Dibothriocephalus latus TaxID=60516 RepID=A0A3P7LWZ2_DIBLA|nr:unnamed protein product [Dibothriocephalus latus]
MTAKSAREDRRKGWTEITTIMKRASNFDDTRKLYYLIPQASGKLSSLNDSVRDVNGGFIADNVAKVKRWREHFEHLLNCGTKPTAPNPCFIYNRASSISYLSSAMRPAF